MTMRQIMPRLKRWEAGDETAWLPIPQVLKWDKFSLKFDEEMANFEVKE